MNKEKVIELIKLFEENVILEKFPEVEDFYVNVIDVRNFIDELKQIVGYEEPKEEFQGGIQICIKRV